MYKPGFVIPVFNHGSTIESVVQSILPFGFPVILIDDGNDEANKLLIQECANKHSEVSLISYSQNQGKGFAMKEGVKKAFEMGLTHIFQLDADGQHDSSSCKSFLELSKENPESLINGFPEYDSSAPKARTKGREFSNVWAKIVTLNPAPKDVLCGFRIYPVEPYMKLIKKHAHINQRMGYDVDILVHLLWLGVPVLNLGVKVSYPKDGISNFHIFRDNISISLTFARLFIGMILRLPCLIYMKLTARRISNDGRK